MANRMMKVKDLQSLSLVQLPSTHSVISHLRYACN